MDRKRKPPFARLKEPERGVRVGLGWYTEEEWAKVRAAAVDPERFESTYVEWLRIAEATLYRFRAVGVDAEKCFINAAELLAWCFMSSRPNDSEARAKFVAEKTRRSAEGRT
jgi:hypothetical protein